MISRHIANIYKENELEKESTVANFATVQNEGERAVERKIEYYNLDVIISVGYRVKSKRYPAFTKRGAYLVAGVISSMYQTSR